jgi:hypothetical protein
MEEWKVDFQGSCAWLITKQCHKQLCDNYRGDGGRRRIGSCSFFVFIIVGLFGVHASLPFHPSPTTTATTTTTTTVKLIVFQYDINTVVTGTIVTAAGIQMLTRSNKMIWAGSENGKHRNLEIRELYAEQRVMDVL